jgi:CheY-like chemotaxis protein
MESQESPRGSDCLAVLVAENDEALRAYMVEVLTEVGYRVIPVCNGKEAVSALQLGHVDVLITDMIMPEHEAIEIILYSRKHFPDLKLIVMSGLLNGHLQAARSLGARAILHEPFSAGDLVRTVESVCHPTSQPVRGGLATETDPSSPHLMTRSEQKSVVARQPPGQSVLATGKVMNDEISRVIRVIDVLAFDTRILAVNAALVAARAGEACMGLGVVVDEMRNLSQRCAQAAKDTSALLEEWATKLNDEKEKVGQVAAAFRTTTQKPSKITTPVDELSPGSGERTTGILQVGEPITQLGQLMPQTGANANSDVGG